MYTYDLFSGCFPCQCFINNITDSIILATELLQDYGSRTLFHTCKLGMLASYTSFSSCHTLYTLDFKLLRDLINSLHVLRVANPNSRFLREASWNSWELVALPSCRKITLKSLVKAVLAVVSQQRLVMTPVTTTVSTQRESSLSFSGVLWNESYL